MSIFVVRLAYRLWDRGYASHMSSAHVAHVDDPDAAVEAVLSSLKDRSLVYAVQAVDMGEAVVFDVDFPTQVTRAQVTQEKWRVIANDIGGGV